MKCFGQKIRNYHCKVVLLDEQELIQEIQSTSNGQELLDNVFKHLNLIETAYFGLRFIDNSGQTNWLDPGKKVIKQLEGTEPFTLYFGVKFYAADPCKLLEEITRYQFYLQIKQDILQGRLPVPFDLAAELGACAVQSELGDYDPRRHCTGYISEFRFVVNQSPDLEGRITELHKSFGGQVPAVAELNYLEKVKWLDMYGVDLHPVLGEDHVDYFLGLTPSGVIVLRNKTKVGNYFWPRISKLHNKGKYFMLRVRNKSNEEQTYGFETPSRAACKHLWKCAVEHHAFFRLVQVAPTTSNPGSKLNSLNARFRDSGRSESSVRRRAQPQFVRTPSRRYTRRVVEGAQDGSDLKEDTTSVDIVPNGVNKTVSVPQPVSTITPSIHRTPSMAQMTRTDSPRSVRSAPWPAPNTGKSTSYTVPSPRSVRSAGVGGNSKVSERERNKEYSKDRRRSASAESNSSVDSRTHRRHRRSHSRKNSDNESEISRSSGKPHHSKRRHKSSSRRDSGSESENHHHRHRHRHKHRHSSSGKYELVDSEVQWKEAQKKQQQAGGVQQAAVVSSAHVGKQANAISSTPTTRKSGYMNSGLETESEASYSNKRRHRRHRSKSPKERLPEELKKHIDFTLIDPAGIPDDQLRQIPYVKVETNTLKSSKIRYNNSIKSNRSINLRQNAPENAIPDVKSELPSSGDSPPPPYAPPAANGTSNSQTIDSLSSVSVNTMSSSTHPNSKKVLSQSSFNGRSTPSASSPSTTNHSFAVPPPPSRVLASNMNKCGLPGFDDYSNSSQVYAAGRQRNPIIGYNGADEALGIHDMQHPSPSESPDSQKVDSHHENSDSGLGTDHHEYYRSENFSSLGYTLPRSQSKGSVVNGTQNAVNSGKTNPTNKYWANGVPQESSASSQQNWFMDLRSATNVTSSGMNMTPRLLLQQTDRRAMTLDRRARKGKYGGSVDDENDVKSVASDSLKTPVIKPPPTPVTSHEMSTEL